MKLPPQAFRVLQMLLENPGQLITRDEFHRALWSPDTFVDFDQGLNNAIKKIRDVLNDSAESPRYIETLPKLGYRFVGSIDASIDLSGNGIPRSAAPNVENQSDAILKPVHGGPQSDSGFLADLPEKIPGPRIFRFSLSKAVRHFRLLALWVLALAVVAGFAVRYRVVWFRPSRVPLDWVPITTLPGSENSPTFAPDSEQIAFDYENGGEWSIYIKRIDDDKMIRLTEPGDPSSCPSWSPDGKLIAYLKGSSGPGLRLRSGVFLMSPSGGERRRLVDLQNVSCHVGWSPDSKTLVYGPAWSASEPPGLFLVDVGNPVPRRILTSPPHSVDVSPAFSHDGSKIAFARNTSLGVLDLYVVASSGGDPRRVTQINANLGGPVWTTDDQRIIFWAGSGWAAALYSVSVNGGTPERLPLGGHTIGQSAISPDGRRLVYSDVLFDPNIWRIDLSKKDGRPAQVIASTRFEAGPDISPDGGNVAFLSDRDGTQGIWTCRGNCSNPQRLELRSADGSVFPVRPNLPRWSPSGDRIAFDALDGGHRQIFVVGADGGTVTQLTSGEFENQAPTWSADGAWIYYGSERTGRYEVFKTSLSTRETRQVTHTGGYFGQESPDGKLIYFDKPDESMATWTYVKPGLYVMPKDGGRERLVIPEATWLWRVTVKGVYFTGDDARHPVMKLFNVATGKVEVLALLDKPAWGGPGGIAISPDGQFFLYTQIDNEGRDLMLVKNGAW